ncbi:putative duf946 domain-containing protein [Botrytis fragariae]|uniref:Putative duf946 domain-containing protein n=1 Tax=Botrytis fragariae TaxID=1964551 RepID=A0A8H6EPA2_9HELO|nr:putative duf946 domain-containing protein [Botrytis fragariae]KAF5879449.1 putative duf946 domain-containing protein [Botrytis fragariae]
MPNQTRTYGDLKVTLTSEYEWVWADTGTGAAKAATFWHPKSQSGDFGGMRPLGTVGVDHYNNINKKQATLLVGATSDSNPAVKSPTGYTRIWISKGMGGKYDNSTWRPIPPPGYLSMGDVVLDCTKTTWDQQPSTDKVWCLRADLTKRAVYSTSPYWDDSKGGGNYDCSVWQVVPEPIVGMGDKNIPITAGTFRGHQSYSKPDSVYALVPVLPYEKQYKRFEASVPKISSTEIPTTGDQYSFSEQCRVALPFISFFDSKDERSLDFIQNPFIDLSRSIAWKVEGVWVNGGEGTYSRQKEIKYGVSKTQSESMTHSAGVQISAASGIGCVEYSVSLNYQFTSESSSSFTEFSESTVTEKFEVPGKNAKVLFSKHIWITASRADGGQILKQLEVVANDDMYFAGCSVDSS